mgnify:CR=1 FL=1
MKLTQKDKEFLETLRKLIESKDLSVELKPDKPSYMVLKGTYGEKIHKGEGFTLNDFKEQMEQMANMGGMAGLLDDPRFNHPSYWAPFLLIGNWL